jgi:predicted DNA-binding transcriptional regulator YafY
VRKLQTHEIELFLHRFVPFHSVLDDETVLKILESICLNKKTKIKYHKLIFEHSCYTEKEFEFDVCPVKIIFDLTLGRWYLACFDDNSHLSMFRVDRIYDAVHLEDRFDYSEAEKRFNKKFKDVWTASIPFNDKKSRKIKLQVTGDKQYILNRIAAEGKDGYFTLENNGTCYFNLNVKDETEILPWLRSLSPHVKIIENDSLKNRMISDLMEMKKNYGII